MSGARGNVVKPKWSTDGLLIYQQTVIGVVEEGASKRGYWAYGCLKDWQDTPLGWFPSKRMAKDAVTEWIGDLR